MLDRVLKKAVGVILTVLLAGEPAHAGALLLYDASDGRVLYAEDADYPWFAASLTKMMTAYLVFDAYETGKVTPETKITISRYANSHPRMRLGLGANKEITFDDALKALLVLSANDIAVAIAEALSGSEKDFVAKMNDTAHDLGMYATRYVNPHGLPGEKQFTTAQDLAILTQALSQRFPQYMPMFSMVTANVGRRNFGNHNPLLTSYDGTDGMKTGFTCSAGYNIVASATRDGHRVVAVVLGATSKNTRSKLARHLLEYGFTVIPWKKLTTGPTIWSLPKTRYNYPMIRELNLRKRYYDCLDPLPDYALAITEASVMSVDPSVVANRVIKAAVQSATIAAQQVTASPPLRKSAQQQ